MIPCEKAVWEVLPAIKARLAQEMFFLGMKQTEIAKALGTTKAAVSQYIKKKRGRRRVVRGKALEKLKKFARTAKRRRIGREERMRVLCEICRSMRGSG